MHLVGIDRTLVTFDKSLYLKVVLDIYYLTNSQKEINFIKRKYTMDMEQNDRWTILLICLSHHRHLSNHLKCRSGINAIYLVW